MIRNALAVTVLCLGLVPMGGLAGLQLAAQHGGGGKQIFCLRGWHKGWDRDHDRLVCVR